MIRRSICIVALTCLATGLVTPLQAQIRFVELSSLVTVPADIPDNVASAALRGDEVRYMVRTSPGFRMVSNPDGILDLREGDAPVLPITIGVGPKLAAGVQDAAVVRFEMGDVVELQTVSMEILARPGLTVSLAIVQKAAPGSRLRLTYEVTNTGNVSDSVTVWLETQIGQVRGMAHSVTLLPFETRQGEFDLDIATETRPGPALVVIKALGGYDLGVGWLEVPVGRGDEGFLASLVTVPTRLFVGSSVRPGPMDRSGRAFGIQAAGELKPGLRFNLSAHQTRESTSAFAFRGLQFGPRFRAQLSSQSFVTVLGDVASRTAPFAGYRLQGRGGSLEVGAGPVKFLAHVARPTGPGGESLEGHQLAGGIELQTPIMVLGLRGVHERRAGEFLSSDQELRSAYLRLEPLRPSTHNYLVDVGWLGLSNLANNSEKQGVALSGRYSYRNGPTVLDVVLRRSPNVDGMRSASADEVRFSGLTEFAEGFGVLGELGDLYSPASGLLEARRSRTAEAGMFLRHGLDQFELRGRIRRTEGTVAFEDRTVEIALEVAAGPGSIDARLETGRSQGQELRTRVLRAVAGYNLRGRRGWGRLGLKHHRDALTSGEVSLDLTGAYRLSDIIEVHGSAATTLQSIDSERRALLQAGAQFDLRPDLALLVGAETIDAVGRSGTEMQFSVGIRKGLPIPVPFPRQRKVRGVVFMDTDGDGIRGPQDQLLDGIRVTMGGTTVTTRRGHFAFSTETRRGPIQVEVASLGDGFIPPSLSGVPGGGELLIPVHRAAALRVEAFLDANRDGVRDPTEIPLPDVSIEVSTQSSAWTLRTSHDGGANLSAIRPGFYTVSVDPNSLPRRAEAPGLLSMTLLGGESGTLLIAVPARTVTFSAIVSPVHGNASSELDDGGK